MQLASHRRAWVTAFMATLLTLGAAAAGSGSAGAAPGPVFVKASFGPRVLSGKLTLTRPAGTAAGDVLVAGVAEHEVGRITAPAGWTLVRLDKVDGDVWLWVWYRVVRASEPSAYTWLAADKAANGAFLAYRGVDTARPVVASAGKPNAGNSTNLIRVPSMNVGSVKNTRLVMFATIEGPTPNPITPPAGFTERTERAIHPSTESSDMLFPGTGATGARTAKAKTAASGVGVIVALRPRP